jgi:photosystem II stability/assembly factor-like uncharacterized protein
VQGLNSNDVYVAGDRGLILRSRDAGASWRSLNSPVSQNLYSIHMATNMTGFAVGAGGVILRTTNGGRSWPQVASGERCPAQ